MIESTSLIISVSRTADEIETTLPELIRLVSRTSSMRLVRYLPEDCIFSRFSRVSCGSSLFWRLISTRPMIAVIGVRISWLMWDRKVSFSLPD